jgi:hypothetical protein
MKYSVPYKRTGKWWVGDWYTLSTWCNENFGQREWDYMNERFMFRQEEHQTLFMLRWL